MGIPARLLSPGEQVVVDVRPHWRFLARPVAAAVLALGGSVAALSTGTPRWAQLAVGALLIACLLWLAVRWLRWTTTSFVVTTARLVVRRGVLRRSGREMLLERLTDISYSQSLLDRLTGSGDLLLESAGRDSPEVLADLPRPLRIRDEIARLAEVRRAGGPATGTWAPGRAADGGVRGATAERDAQAPVTVAEQLSQLGDLRRRGVISRREFAAKKAELLSRL